MAWRDSRKSRSRLFLFIASIVLGIASLVAMYSFNANLKRDIDDQAAGLIGADLELESRRKPSEAALAFVDSLIGLSEDHAREERFVSMARFPKANGSRLVQVRALSGAFPFYGTLETVPVEGALHFGQEQSVLVDKTLMLQFGAEVQDTLQLGVSDFSISGSLINSPGQTAFSGAMAPTVYVPLRYLEGTGLQQVGSRIEYRYYFKFPQGFRVDDLVKQLDDRLEELQLQSATIASTKESAGRSFSDVADFMGLVGFIALLLGCIGVSSAVHIYVREKLVTVAILRCLGTSARQAFFIFLVQIAGIGLAGGILGALLGTMIQYFLPLVMQDFLPVALSSQVSWPAIVQGVGLGMVISILFALVPLVAVRHISPLNTLRVNEETAPSWKDPLRWWIYSLIVVFVVVFARWQLRDWMQTFFFMLGIAFTFALLYGVAKGFVYLIRRHFPSKWPYLWRQGLANLYRPHNQTLVLLVSIGLGTAFIATLFFVQDMLLERVSMASSNNQANMVLFDIQTGQKDSVKHLTLDAGLPVMQEVPIVTMQIAAINGHTMADIRSDSTSELSQRAFRGEIRATYRDSLFESEKITDGKWIGEVMQGDTGQVSLEKRYAERIGVQVGDRLLLNVQGVTVPAIVSSFREVDWNRFQTNFRLVFAKGTIDQAPQFHVLMTRINSESESAAFQQLIVSRFPNISVLDLNMILEVLDSLLEKIGFVIQFIGGFSILTGLVVLIASVMISKYQRIRENVLLRTLGASRRQILVITLCEYLFLGVLASFTGIMLAVLGSSLLAVFVFETSFIPPMGGVLLLVLSVSALTVFIGVINSLSILRQSPLEVLRKE